VQREEDDLKQTLADLAETANRIGRRKFIQMSSKKQHQLLAALSWDTLASEKRFGDFVKRYHQLLSWSDLDRYQPPAWLTDKEALAEYMAFHMGFANTPFEEKTFDIKSTEPLSWQPKVNVEVALDQVRSPYNVGSILRIIDNFGFKRLVHSTDGLRPDHPQLIKAARGSHHWIPICKVNHLPEYLSAVDMPVIGLESDSAALSITAWQPPEGCVLVVGNEAYGIAEAVRAVCDQMVRIPMAGFKTSMNVHQALAVVGFKIVETYGNGQGRPAIR
jgi:tRNA G18 (ribose-2'-O)-methylase SpoU